MMKKTFNIFAFMVALTAMVGCSPEMESNFPKPASERIEIYKKDVQSILKGAANGWRMEYFTGYGGYNMFARFDSLKVTVGGEQIGPNHPAGIDPTTGKMLTETSSYKLEQSEGLILSFDTNNDILHYLSTPDNPDYGEKGTGLEGDFEFRVMSACADSVILVGKKHQAKIRLLPMPNNLTWEQYIDEVNATNEYMASRSYTLEVNNDPTRQIDVTTSYRIMTFTWLNDKEETQKVNALYIVTKEGLKFYRSYMVDSCEITGFAKGDTQEFFYPMNGTHAKLWTYVPTLGEYLQTGSWFILYDNLGAYAQPKWEEMRLKLKTSGPNKTPERLYWAIIGNYNQKLGLHMQAGGNYALQGVSITILDSEKGDEVQIKRDTKIYNSNGRTYYSKYGMDAAMEPFVAKYGRTFKLETDNNRKPTYMILRDKEEPTNVIRLMAEESYYVYGDRDDYSNE